MTVLSPKAEFNQHRKLLDTAVGGKGSGAARYAAAMFFYNKGLIGTDMLEIYRRCSKFDKEDPIDLARFEGVSLLSIDSKRALRAVE